LFHLREALRRSEVWFQGRRSSGEQSTHRCLGQIETPEGVVRIGVCGTAQSDGSPDSGLHERQSSQQVLKARR
jgi:hypothetical protein